MIRKVYDDKCSYEVGKNNVGIITQWRVNKDSVDIYRIADKDNNLIIFHGFSHKDYVVEYNDEPILGRQMSIFEI